MNQFYIICYNPEFVEQKRIIALADDLSVSGTREVHIVEHRNRYFRPIYIINSESKIEETEKP
jgi:hypothetical protein